MTLHSRRLNVRSAAGPQAGLTLVELMVTLTIGLIMIGAMSMLFIGSSTTRREVESAAEAIENGRYAIDLLGRELSLAGYYGTLTTPAGDTDASIPCSSTPADWIGSLGIHALGWNQDAADPACLIDRKPGTDAIFIQRASTCEAGVDGCAGVSTGVAYLQVSECGEEDGFELGEAPDEAGAPPFDHLKTKTCDAEVAPLRRFVRGVYFVDTDDVLNYREFGPGLGLDGSTTVPLIENIEQLQFSYAIDTDGNGSPDAFDATPAADEWPNVIGVRVWVLARSATEGDRPDGVPSFELDDMPDDGIDLNRTYRRRVSTGYISFVSPTLRRAK